MKLKGAAVVAIGLMAASPATGHWSESLEIGERHQQHSRVERDYSSGGGGSYGGTGFSSLGSTGGGGYGVSIGSGGGGGSGGYGGGGSGGGGYGGGGSSGGGGGGGGHPVVIVHQTKGSGGGGGGGGYGGGGGGYGGGGGGGGKDALCSGGSSSGGKPMVIYISDPGNSGGGSGTGYSSSGTGGYGYGGTGGGHGDICGTICAVALPLALLASVFNLISSGFGFVTVTTGTGRKRRDVSDAEVDEKLREFSQVQEFVHESLDLGMEFNLQEDIVAKYLRCSGMTEVDNHCLEHLACSYSDSTYKHSPAEKTAISVIIHTIMDNHQIEEEVKERLKGALAFGQQNPGSCLQFTCDIPALAAATSAYPLPSLSNIGITTSNHGQPIAQNTQKDPLTHAPSVKSPTLVAPASTSQVDIAAAIHPYIRHSENRGQSHKEIGSHSSYVDSLRDTNSVKHRGKPSARQGREQ